MMRQAFPPAELQGGQRAGEERNNLMGWGYYNAIAGGYDELHGEEQARKVSFIQGLVNPAPSTRILDVGCGTGLSMKGWHCHIEGVDPSREMVEIATTRGLKVAIAAAERLPFSSESFDLVMAITSAHHISKKGFEEMARVAPKSVFTMPKRGGVEDVKARMLSSWRIVSEHCCFQDIVWLCQRQDPLFPAAFGRWKKLL